MPRGGKRPGAGKPKGYRHRRTAAKATAKERFVARIVAEWDPVIDAQLDRAKGVMVMLARAFETDKAGRRARTGRFERITDASEMAELLNNSVDGEDYYRLAAQDADTRMLIELNARVMGKVSETMAVTGPDGGPVQIHHHFAAL